VDVTLFANPHSRCPVPTRSIIDFESPVIGDSSTELAHVLGAYAQIEPGTVVHDNTLSGPLVCPRDAELPVVVTNHGPYHPHIEAIFSSYPKNVELISISKSQASETHLPSTVIYHGIDVDLMPDGDGDGGYALFLGRMAESKGVHRAIQIAKAAGSRLLIAAKMLEPAEIAYFKKFVEPHLDDDIVYVGEADAVKKLELLAGASALINPIRWSEPFGMVMIEALACGTPVLACPHGAAPEIIEHGVSGYLSDDLDELAAFLPTVKSLDRSACRLRAKEHFSVDRMVQDHVALYRRVLEKCRSRETRPPMRNGERASITRTGRP
jgi:glycosyltransferase involved in cell wall biosynthesis